MDEESQETEALGFKLGLGGLMSAVENSTRGELTDRCIMVILDEQNLDVFQKVLQVYFKYFKYDDLWVNDTTGKCKNTNVHELDVSVATWRKIFKILNLAGYYVVHDINVPDLWVVGTYDDLVANKKYVEYIKLMTELMEEGEPE